MSVKKMFNIMDFGDFTMDFSGEKSIMRVGLIEFIIGILILFVAVALVVFV